MTEATPDVQFFCASETARTLKDLRVKQKGQPVYVMGHEDAYKGKEAVFEHFNVRLAVVKFPEGKTLGFDPSELLLPCEIDQEGIPFFEIRYCELCDQLFPLTLEEFHAPVERTQCPECAP
ncbi:MAG: hypothetical protein AB7P17_03680 [Nitrospirales bacterium]|nr:hypothetical protein [Nitrospirales bacterium]